MPWFSLLIFGVAIGACSGLMGIGGGVLLVPGLVLLFGFSQPEAQGTSLAVLIPPIGLFAAMIYYQHGYIRLPVVGFIAAGFLVGAYVGAVLVPYVPLTYLRLALGLLLLYLGFTFVFNPAEKRTATALPAAIATALSTVSILLVRRKILKRRELLAPGEDSEYHI
jgi:uncharacterized membrane protein YfcA